MEIDDNSTSGSDENISAEKLVEEVKKESDSPNIKKRNNTKGLLIILSVVFIVLVIIAGILDSQNSEDCDSTLCSLTGRFFANDNQNIVAEFGEYSITSQELDNNYEIMFFLRGLPEEYRSMLTKRTFLDQSITEELLYQNAVKDGFSLDRLETGTILEESLINSGASIDQFKSKIEEAGINYDSVLDFYSKQISINKYLDSSLFKDVKVEDQEILDYYKNNPTYFNVPDQIRASHILVNTSIEAKEIIDELDKGSDFSELANEKSIGPSGPNGGDLGYFGKGSMVKDFEDVAFALKNIGDYTEEPVKTEFGYHIILLTDKKAASVLSYEESKDQIKQQLLTEKQNELFNGYLEGIRDNIDVKIYEENINENSLDTSIPIIE